MQSPERALYWIVAGTLMGFGFIGFGFGLLPLLLGIAMAVYGLWRIGPRGLWMVITTAGVIPVVVLLYQYFAFDPVRVSLGPNHLMVVAVFGALALAGLVWGFLSRRAT